MAGRGKNSSFEPMNKRSPMLKTVMTIDEQVEYLTKNAVQVLPETDLRKKLSRGKPLRIKFGIDPTAADIHLGHVVVLDSFRRFQDLGHQLYLIIGDMTALVGDPSGRSKTRPILSDEKIKENVKTFQNQAYKILDPEKTNIVYNSEWLNMPVGQMFSLLSQATVSQILEREDFKKRFSNQDSISMLEMVYPLLQAYDSVHLGADVEVGGTDQTFNLLLARALQDKIKSGSEDYKEAQVVMTLPILPGTDGKEKMSKSLDNYIGITEPASEIYGKTLSLLDDAMKEYYKLLLHKDLDPNEHPREAKRFLARSLVERFYSQEDALKAEADFDAKFKKGSQDIDAIKKTAKTFSADRLKDFSSPREEDKIDLVALLADSFRMSRNDIRRHLKSEAVKIEGKKIDFLDVPKEEIDGKLISVGKRNNLLVS